MPPVAVGCEAGLMRSTMVLIDLPGNESSVTVALIPTLRRSTSASSTSATKVEPLRSTTEKGAAANDTAEPFEATGVLPSAPGSPVAFRNTVPSIGATMVASSSVDCARLTDCWAATTAAWAAAFWLDGLAACAFFRLATAAR